MDLKDFFPNISNFRVYKTFSKDLGCSPEVSRYLTKITTLNGSLPQGSPTSTILSALVAKSLSIRLEKLTKKYGLSYSQFVDDITVSGSSHIINLIDKIEKIIKQEGFKINSAKTEVINEAQEQVVTGVRVNAGLDSPNEKIKKTRNEIKKVVVNSVEGRGNLESKLASIKGKINYITGLNKGAGASLKRRLKKEISVMNSRIITSNS